MPLETQRWCRSSSQAAVYSFRCLLHTCQNDSTVATETAEGRRRLDAAVLQPVTLVTNDEAKFNLLNLQIQTENKHDEKKGVISGSLYVKPLQFRTDLLQTPQQHFIADDEDRVKRRQDKLLYPVVLHMQQQRIHKSQIIHSGRVVP